MSYSLDVYTCSFLNHELKTCDYIYSRCKLVQLVDLARPLFPIFLILSLGPFLPVVVTAVSGSGSGCRHHCWLLTLKRKNLLDCLLTRAVQLALFSSGNYNNNHILYR